MKKILQEILNKLNFTMSNTFINEQDTLMDLYNENIDKTIEQIDAIDITDPKAIDTMKAYAFKFGYKIEGNYIIIESNNFTYRIKKELWTK